MPSRKPASRRKKSQRRSTVGKITPPLDVRSEDSISSLMKLITKGPITIILVYADWCGHCHTFKPKFDEAATNRKLPFQVASINDTMINSVNKHINSINNSETPIKVEGYPTIVSLNNKGEFIKEIPQETSLKILNTPMPNTVSTKQNVSMRKASMNTPMNASMKVPMNASMKVPITAPMNVPMNVPMIAKKQPNIIPQARVSEPLLHITGGNYEVPVAPKYLGGCLYKSLSSTPFKLGNPSNLLHLLASNKSRKSKSKK